jgi:hypothetical protein
LLFVSVAQLQRAVPAAEDVPTLALLILIFIERLGIFDQMSFSRQFFLTCCRFFFFPVTLVRRPSVFRDAPSPGVRLEI